MNKFIGTQTPYRISLLGGGSDCKHYYNNDPGMVLNLTIQNYMYVFVKKNFDENKIILKYNGVEEVSDWKKIKHPLTKRILSKEKEKNLEIVSIGEFPSGTGLGSSSAFTIGLLNALGYYNGEKKEKMKLAIEASEIESILSDGSVGKQDQYASSFGGINMFTFNKDESVLREKIVIPELQKKRFEQSLIMFYTGITRNATKVLKEQVKCIENSKIKQESLKSIVNMVPDLGNELRKGNIESLGYFLNEGWKIKRALSSSISTLGIDEIYKKGRRLGATGGKLLGAGGGGFVLFFCPPEKQQDLINNIELKHFKINIDELGTRSMFNN